MPYIFKNGFTKMAKSKKSNLEQSIIRYNKFLDKMIEAKELAMLADAAFIAYLNDQEQQSC